MVWFHFAGIFFVPLLYLCDKIFFCCWCHFAPHCLHTVYLDIATVCIGCYCWNLLSIAIIPALLCVLFLRRLYWCPKPWCAEGFTAVHSTWLFMYFGVNYIFLSVFFLCLCFGSDSCRALQTGSPWNCSPGCVLAPPVMNAVCSVLCLW